MGYMDANIWPFLMFPILYLFTHLSNISLLSPVNMFGLASLVVIMLMVYNQAYVYHGWNDHKLWDLMDRSIPWSTLGVAFGSCAFSNGNLLPMCLPLHASMRKPAYFPLAFRMGAFLCWLSYVTFGYAGTTRWEKVDPSVTVNFPPTNVFQVMVVCACFYMLCSMALPIFMIIDSLQENWPWLKKSAWPWLLRLSVVATVVLGSIVTDNITDVFDITGCVIYAALIFLLPVLAYMEAMGRDLSMCRRVECLIILLLGVV